MSNSIEWQDVAPSLRDLGNEAEAEAVERVGAVADTLFKYLTEEPSPARFWGATLVAMEEAGYELPDNFARVAKNYRAAQAQAGGDS